MTNVVALALLLHGEGSWLQWKTYPSFLIGWLLLGALYFAVIGPWRGRFPGSRPVPAKRVGFFVVAMTTMFVALQGPIHEVSDRYLFWVHMVQHLLLILVMPPFLVAATPDWALRPLVRRPVIGKLARLLTLPLVAFGLNNLVFMVWHYPGPYDLMMRNHDVHIGMHLTIMVTGTIMWWPVMSPMPELPRLAPPLQMLYLFVLGIPMMVVAALISFSDRVLYPFYAAQPRLFGIDALQDQQLGGVIMWVPGALVMWLAITTVYFRWSHRETTDEERALAGRIRPSRAGMIAPPPYPRDLAGR